MNPNKCRRAAQAIKINNVVQNLAFGINLEKTESVVISSAKKLPIDLKRKILVIKKSHQETAISLLPETPVNDATAIAVLDLTEVKAPVAVSTLSLRYPDRNAVQSGGRGSRSPRVQRHMYA